MKTIISILSISVAVLFFSTAGFSQKKDIKGVKSIELDLACQLVLVQGSSPNFEIVGDKDAIDDIETRISNGKLIIKSDRKYQHKEDVVVKIEVDDLDYLELSGVVDMKTVRQLVLDDFEMSVSGVGNVDMGLDVKNFKLECSGVANVNLNGKATDIEMDISGVGKVDAVDLVAKNAEVSNSGVGRVTVNATDNLDADVSGLGTINYEGTPMLHANVSGLGKISRY